MSSTFRQIYYHIVFSTKHREPTIKEENCRELYRRIWGILNSRNCKLYRVNGVEDHLHLLIDLHPSLALADLMREVKSSTSLWMKQSGLFPDFAGWQDGYGAFTCSARERDRIIGYIRKQKEHHRREGAREEFRRLLVENEVAFEERYV